MIELNINGEMFQYNEFKSFSFRYNWWEGSKIIESQLVSVYFQVSSLKRKWMTDAACRGPCYNIRQIYINISAGMLGIKITAKLNRDWIPSLQNAMKQWTMYRKLAVHFMVLHFGYLVYGRDYMTFLFVYCKVWGQWVGQHIWEKWLSSIIPKTTWYLW